MQALTCSKKKEKRKKVKNNGSSGIRTHAKKEIKSRALTGCATADQYKIIDFSCYL